MNKINKVKVATGIYWIEIKEANVRILCGCPADSIKHLMKRGLINSQEKNGIIYESGPNVILLSDILIQNGEFSNLAEFPVLQMLYRQGMILPKHPNNTGTRPLIIGSYQQVKSQLEYIYRGNYGLISEQELISAGVDANTAKELMRMKLKFAFGKIKQTEELLDIRIIEDDKIEIMNNVYIKRKKINIFEIEYESEKIEVDLNLCETENYESAYPLGYYTITREYFSILHSGDGDGWDTNRPTMSSIIIFQGKIYLIDAGPNISYFLNALGIGINEITGIFHTHSHDDHFCGLPFLMQTDHKIKYYATKLVKSSVAKKLQALFNKTDDLFDDFFEFIELKENKWNSIDGLEARPIFSPHPVETTIFVFRTLSENGYKYYGHFADIIDLDILKNWITPSSVDIGISEDLYNSTKQEYLQKLDLKKIDIGGGLIHGNALNFKDDKSTKIILSHTALPLTDEQKEIGSGAVFGMTDILIPAYRDYILKNAYYSLKSYFPNIPQNQIEILLNNKIQLFRPEEIIIKNSEKSEYVYLILSGNVEGINANKKIKRILSAGAMIGLKSAVFNKYEMFTFRTKSYCNILIISIKLFNEFLKNNNLIDKFKELNDRRLFLENTWLFSNMVSYQLQNHIIFNMKLIEYPKNTIIENTIDGIYIINKGKIELSINDCTVEILNNYDFFNEASILYNIYDIFKKKCLTNVSLYFLPKKYIKDIPSIYWRLEEIYNKRSRKIFNSEIINKNNFGWLEEYSINIKEIDEQHKKLFEITYKIIKSFDLCKDKNEIKKTLDRLLEYTHYHFKSEEEYMQNCGYSAIDQHINKHQYLIKELKKYYDYFLNNRHFSSNTFISFLKYWITEHILTEDKKLSFLCSS